MCFVGYRKTLFRNASLASELEISAILEYLYNRNGTPILDRVSLWQVIADACRPVLLATDDLS